MFSIVDPSSRTAKFEEMTNLSSFKFNDYPRKKHGYNDNKDDKDDVVAADDDGRHTR